MSDAPREPSEAPESAAGEEPRRPMRESPEEAARRYARELEDLRERLGAERARRQRAEHERDELRRELEEVRPRGRPWWVLGLLVVVVVSTVIVLSLGAILSTP